MADTGRDRDLVLPPGQFAYVLDETKGIVSVHVGPTKTSLSNTDRPVLLDGQRYNKVDQLERATQQCPIADEGDYIILENPPVTKENADQHPAPGNSTPPKLQFGRKINIPGPITFALWPGQVAKVVTGHRLRSNQYLLGRVYNDSAARENWEKSVIKQQTEGDQTAAAKKEKASILSQAEITMGKLFVVKGTEVSFYIPPTGVEIVPDEDGSLVREAVTLERLEYCILVDEDGNKRYERGPAVVFPRPTESFVKKEDVANNVKSRRFKAYELSPISGIYIKVIADYEEGTAPNAVKHLAGEELFITGNDQAIYFPRPEHAIIKYGDQDIYYAIAIPKGEGRYVLDRLSGKVELVEGPRMFMPDPRTQVIVRRVLTQHQVDLWYPGNTEAKAYNAELESAKGTENFLRQDYAVAATQQRSFAASAPAFADELKRKTKYSPPRTIVIDSKWDGVPAIGVWTGYAVQINNKSGESMVVVGPAVVNLQYDESLEVLVLSTGKPKTTDHPIETVYLRVFGNKVSDIATVETKDMCKISVKLSYRVHFEGEDQKKWFAVDNYVKFMCDHVRSMLSGVVKKYSVEEFYANSVEIIRNAILGSPVQGGERAGLKFAENSMKVYDVEVLDITIGDTTINQLLTNAQHACVAQAIEANEARSRLASVTAKEAVQQQIDQLQADTALNKLKLDAAKAAKVVDNALATLAADLQKEDSALKVAAARESTKNTVAQADLARQKAAEAQAMEVSTARQKLAIEMIEKEAAALVTKFDAVKGEFGNIALALSNNETMKTLAQASAPLTILGGKSVVEIIAKIFEGTGLSGVLTKALANVTK